MPFFFKDTLYGFWKAKEQKKEKRLLRHPEEPELGPWVTVILVVVVQNLHFVTLRIFRTRRSQTSAQEYAGKTVLLLDRTINT